MYIIDFDDTLFDTQRYKQERMRSLVSLGVSEEIFWQTYARVRKNERGEMVYSDERHATLLEEYGFEKNKILAAFDVINKKAKGFLFSDTLYFLQEIKKTQAPLILLSLGDPHIQEMKVKGSGIDVYFDRMFLVTDTKKHLVKGLLDRHSQEKVWFINDKINETKEVCDISTLITPVLRQSPNIAAEEYHKSGIVYFQSLTEILKYVQS